MVRMKVMILVDKHYLFTNLLYFARNSAPTFREAVEQLLYCLTLNKKRRFTDSYSLEIRDESYTSDERVIVITDEIHPDITKAVESDKWLTSYWEYTFDCPKHEGEDDFDEFVNTMVLYDITRELSCICHENDINFLHSDTLFCEDILYSGWIMCAFEEYLGCFGYLEWDYVQRHSHRFYGAENQEVIRKIMMEIRELRAVEEKRLRGGLLCDK